jgi:hypothetical protein
MAKEGGDHAKQNLHSRCDTDLLNMSRMPDWVMLQSLLHLLHGCFQTKTFRPFQELPERVVYNGTKRLLLNVIHDRDNKFS